MEGEQEEHQQPIENNEEAQELQEQQDQPAEGLEEE